MHALGVHCQNGAGNFGEAQAPCCGVCVLWRFAAVPASESFRRGDHALPPPPSYARRRPIPAGEIVREIAVSLGCLTRKVPDLDRRAGTVVPPSLVEDELPVRAGPRRVCGP